MIPPDLSNLPAEDQQRIMPAIQYREILGQIALLDKITKDCFKSCVYDLTRTEMLKREKNCVKKCHEKLMELQQRGQYKMSERQAIQQIQSTISTAQ